MIPFFDFSENFEVLFALMTLAKARHPNGLRQDSLKGRLTQIAQDN
jgi:hypothetical protein